MSVRFILGPAGSGKTYHCLQQISEAAGRQPFGAPLIFLLPEQATFIHERMLAERLGCFCRAEALSFDRMIYRMRGQLGGESAPFLSEAGKMLMMSKILSADRERLMLFSAGAANSGLAADLVSLFEELQAYDVGVPRLAALAAHTARHQPQQAWSRKLADVALLYEHYMAEMSEAYGSKAAAMRELAATIGEGRYLAGAAVYVDGYSEFTPLEMSVLAALMQRAGRLEIALPMDIDDEGMVGDEQLFAASAAAYAALTETARRLRVEVEPPLILDGRAQGRFARQPELAALERSLRGIRQAPSEQPPQNVSLHTALDRREELQGVGREIMRLVREQGLRFRDISVITRDSEPYRHLLPTVFGDMGIPYFIDSKKPLLYHPLIELVRAFLEIRAYRPQYRNIFRYLKNPLSPIAGIEADMLENYALAYGVKAWQWTDGRPWTRVSAKEPEGYLTEIERIRHLGADSLLAALNKLPDAATAAELNAALLQLLRELGVDDKLAAWEREALLTGDGEAAETQRQVWSKLLAFFAEAEQLLGETRFTAAQFAELYDAAFRALTLSMIPPGLDQVLVASLERSRNPEIGAAFVLSLNDGVLPARVNEGGVFSDAERRTLAEAGLSLAPDSVSRQFRENYLAYVALTRSGGQLALSYLLADDDGASLAPSTLIRQLRRLWPQLQPQAYGEPLDERRLIGGVSDLAACAVQLSRARAGQAIDGFWWPVYGYYQRNERYRPQLAAVLDGLYYRPLSQPLSAASRQRLYGGRIRGSASRLEKFRLCPFSYFAGYGLKLKPREEYKLDAAARGELFHQVLADIGRAVAGGAADWQTMQREQAERLVDSALARYLPHLLAGVLQSSARYRYLSGRIREALVATLLLQAEQYRAGEFVTVAWELPFGLGGDGLPALVIELGGGKRLEICGVIDRVDMAAGQNVNWFRIVDYKTGAVSLSAEDIFSGLKMQLMLYLQVVLQNSGAFAPGQAAAAGVYYAPVLDTLQSVPEPNAPLKPEGLRFSGLTVLDESAVRLADRDIRGHSRYIPAALGEKGFYANSPGVEQPRLFEMRMSLEQVLKQTATAMLDGLISVSPLGDGSFTACAYCDYRPLCGFDAELASLRHKQQKQAVEEDGHD
ncbi:MAG: PD-(D/E)XK nuclease family protein [Bacillota bacterium]|nr:PD-(D/E)XK nuclease family protein [Bacillota bacterium]